MTGDSSHHPQHELVVTCPRPDPSTAAAAHSCVSWVSTTRSSRSTRRKSITFLALCTLAVIGAAGMWLIAGYLVQELLPVYPAPSMLAYLSVCCMQAYFLLVSVRPIFPPSRDGARNESTDEADWGGDVHTNRETAKMALQLFMLFSLAFGLLFHGLARIPQSGFVGALALIAPFSFVLVLTGLCTETVTRFKTAAVTLVTCSALLTVFEPVVSGEVGWDAVMTDIGYGMVGLGAVLFALFLVLLHRLTEHTFIQKPLVFAFIGMFCMLTGWIVFLPLHYARIEPLVFPPSDSLVYWHLIGIVALGAVFPVFLLQWALTRTSPIHVTLLLAAIIPLYGVSEAVWWMQWSWIDLVAALAAIGGICMANWHYVQ